MEKDLDKFLFKYNKSKSDFLKTGFKWESLLEIADEYKSKREKLKLVGKNLVDILLTLEKVHSVRLRIKDEEHLIDKIIRKKLANPKRKIDITNYLIEIRDLIGLRILHLFKEDWNTIHNHLEKNFDLVEKPIAYIRKGDLDIYKDNFSNNKCDVKEHNMGYRSVHYTIKTKPYKEEYFAEIQVRTIFEEAWSEIDHTLRYPSNKVNERLEEFLVLFNRVAGSSDEMGSFIRSLKYEIEEVNRNKELLETENKEFKEKVTQLENQIKETSLSQKQKESLITNINFLKERSKISGMYGMIAQKLLLDSNLNYSINLKNDNHKSTLKAIFDNDIKSKDPSPSVSINDQDKSNLKQIPEKRLRKKK